jgi:alpha-beta hydrolase superfamily lysophospholipase
MSLDFSVLPRLSEGDLPPHERFVARDGTPLAFRRWRADVDCVVVAIHGSSAESTYLHTLASALAAHGAAEVWAPDLRGHGASGGRRGDVDYIGQLEDDLDDLLVVVRKAKPSANIFLLGHSSGGGLVVRFAGGRDACVSGYVLLSPFLGHAAETTRPASGGWTEIDPAMLSGPAEDAVVLRFNKPVSERTGRETLAYTFRMVVSYAPRPDLGADLEAMKKPLLVVAGAADEAFVAERYEPVMSPHVRGTFRVLSGVTHLGVAVAPLTIETVADWLARSGARSCSQSLRRHRLSAHGVQRL